jgi:acyl carrier protein
MNEREIRENLRTYIARELIRDASYPIEDDEHIISDGLIDSFSLAELAVHIENQFGVHIPDVDLTVAKMDTLNQIVARVLKG